MKKLTPHQIALQDKIEQIAYEAVAELLGYEPEWDMEWIGEIADALTDVAVNHFDKNEQDVYPFLEEENK